MGDVAVGARAGSAGEPEERPGTTAVEPVGRPPQSAADQEHGRAAADGAGSRPEDAPGAQRRPGPQGGQGGGAGGRDDGDGGDGGGENEGDGEADGGPEGAPGRGRRRRRPAQRSFWKELPILILIALVLALLIKTFLVQAFSIPSDSMQNTLQRGDRVLVDKLTPWFGSTPERGEVIVFHDPGNWLGDRPDSGGGFWGTMQDGLSFIGLMPSAEEQDLIKRVIAVGGDTVECVRGGPVTVNGKPMDESDFVYPGNTPCDDKPFGPITIPEGRLWVMGDHRQESQDSRYHTAGPGGGTISENDVVGRAIVVAWPPNRWSYLSVPDAYEDVPAALAGAAPGVLGLAGAVPLVAWHRRRLLRAAAAADGSR
ncbi:signal peptidase I [Streptomyces aidingensis]|uniref:Signal peptidase I n=1 Tax=Streptomyces aidingensis TaxID=910347 RepID=A0A1I1NZ88_9ACTN|nr:signal peptidase I [Streptomyces aidingensis]SFD00808.1 signal peptidase I [Streptomyces aidingensis]